MITTTVGRIGVGRVFRGTMKVGQQVALMKVDGSVKQFRVTKLFGYMGLKRQEIEEAKAGLSSRFWYGRH